MQTPLSSQTAAHLSADNLGDMYSSSMRADGGAPVVIVLLLLRESKLKTGRLLLAGLRARRLRFMVHRERSFVYFGLFGELSDDALYPVWDCFALGPGTKGGGGGGGLRNSTSG